MTAIHQFLPTWEPGAIGSHAARIRQIVRAEGIDSEVFAYESSPAMPEPARPYRDYGTSVVARDDDVLLYHAAIGSEVADFLLARHETLIVDYHNMTPAAIFEPWDPAIAENLAWGRRQLAALARRATTGIADSAFNARELAAAGFARPLVVPVLVDVTEAAAEYDASAFEALARTKRGSDWLFVGRVAPNKAQHDLVKAFAVYRRVYDRDARLHVVGAISGQYGRSIRRLADVLELSDAIDFAGSVSAGALSAHYRNADVFVCLSEHEGFCVPLLEAMHHGVPIVAFSAAAVAETLGDAGVLLDDKRPALVAAAVRRVLSDERLRAAAALAGRRRLDDFAPGKTRSALLEILGPMMRAGARA